MFINEEDIKEIIETLKLCETFIEDMQESYITEEGMYELKCIKNALCKLQNGDD